MFDVNSCFFFILFDLYFNIVGWCSHCFSVGVSQITHTNHTLIIACLSGAMWNNNLLASRNIVVIIISDSGSESCQDDSDSSSTAAGDSQGSDVVAVPYQNACDDDNDSDKEDDLDSDEDEARDSSGQSDSIRQLLPDDEDFMAARNGTTDNDLLHHESEGESDGHDESHDGHVHGAHAHVSHVGSSIIPVEQGGPDAAAGLPAAAVTDAYDADSSGSESNSILTSSPSPTSNDAPSPPDPPPECLFPRVIPGTVACWNCIGYGRCGACGRQLRRQRML